MPAENRRGISLLEAIVGLAIVGIVSVAALSAAAAELRAAERSRRAIEAGMLAKEHLKYFDLLRREQLLSLPDSMARGRFSPPLEAYRWTAAVGNRDKEQGVYDVKLQIEWETGVYTVFSALYRPPLIATPQGP